MIKRIIQYISYDIWFKKEHEYKSKKVRWAVRQFKVLLFTAQGFGEHSLLVRSAALTFYTLMSLVPIAALVFGIAKGFGLEARLSGYLHAQFPQYGLVVDQVIGFAEAMLQRTKGGLIASVGLVVLFWAVIKVFGNVESAFNNIWEVRKSRSFARKVSDYISVIVITPILWIISSSIRLQVQDQLLHIAPTPAVQILFGLVSFVVMWIMFAFLYYVMPNTKVRIRSAITAGILSGTGFQVFQYVYIYIQSGLTSYNAIYGSFAAVPLFLIWMQSSWQIVLIGAELSFAYQNIDKFEYEKVAGEMSYEYRKKAMLAAMHRIVTHFLSKESGGVASETIARDINLPVRIVRDVLFDLEKAGVIVPVVNQDEKTSFYIPAKDVHSLTVTDVIKLVEKSGKESLAMKESPELHRVGLLLKNLDSAAAESPDNVRIMDMDKIGKRTEP